MKKLGILLLIFIYSSTVFGYSVNKFYCCGKLSAISISTNFDFKCSCKSMPDCCKTVKTNFKIKDCHFANPHALYNENFIFDLTREKLFSTVEQFQLYSTTSFNSHSPPINSTTLYSLFCTYRI